jgi:mRNA-degrading endonuclease RelE of RelBE toxin-antitoxin system
MTRRERFDLVSFIARDPEAGEVIQGTGGVRKVRFAGKRKDKSGGFRVITFFTGPNLPVFLLTVYEGRAGELDQGGAERPRRSDRHSG